MTHPSSPLVCALCGGLGRIEITTAGDTHERWEPCWGICRRWRTGANNSPATDGVFRGGNAVVRGTGNGIPEPALE